MVSSPFNLQEQKAARSLENRQKHILSVSCYQQATQTQRPVLPAFEFNQDVLLQWLQPGVRVEWETVGSVIIVDAFKWWWESGISDLVLEEFDMYRHHIREINGKSNLGWQRNQIHSLSQQLMRQDPYYYIAYAALRPDGRWRLISYPYYTKYTVPGDHTFFRHIDINIQRLISEERGANMIQGSLSLDDEDKDCTEILPGFHKHIRNWFADACKRDEMLKRERKAKPIVTNGFVHQMSEELFSKADAVKCGVTWTRQPCKKGDVRITMPHLPHGSTGPATQV